MRDINVFGLSAEFLSKKNPGVGAPTFKAIFNLKRLFLFSEVIFESARKVPLKKQALNVP